MKVYMGYGRLKKICSRALPIIHRYDPDYIVAVARGGLTAAHIIGYSLQKPIIVFYPRDNAVTQLVDTPHKLVFVEDLIAKGRTFEIVKSAMEQKCIDFRFFPVVIDAEYKIEDARIINVGQKYSEWIIFPYEDDNLVVEGERTLSAWRA